MTRRRSSNAIPGKPRGNSLNNRLRGFLLFSQLSFRIPDYRLKKYGSLRITGSGGEGIPLSGYRGAGREGVRLSGKAAGTHAKWTFVRKNGSQTIGIFGRIPRSRKFR